MPLALILFFFDTYKNVESGVAARLEAVPVLRPANVKVARQRLGYPLGRLNKALALVPYTYLAIIIIVSITAPAVSRLLAAVLPCQNRRCQPALARCFHDQLAGARHSRTSSLSDLWRRERESAPARTVFAGFAGP